jgi:hypothetical protein
MFSPTCTGWSWRRGNNARGDTLSRLAIPAGLEPLTFGWAWESSLVSIETQAFVFEIMPRHSRLNLATTSTVRSDDFDRAINWRQLTFDLRVFR